MVVKKHKGNRAAVAQGYHLVVHPLDDVREQKIDMSHLGRMPMTPSVRASLFVLQGYLLLMSGLVAYHVFVLAQN